MKNVFGNKQYNTFIFFIFLYILLHQILYLFNVLVVYLNLTCVKGAAQILFKFSS